MFKGGEGNLMKKEICMVAKEERERERERERWELGKREKEIVRFL